MTATEIDLLLERRRRVVELRRDPAKAARLRELSEWQARRLTWTYADLRREPRYALAVQFFLSDLYGPHDFTRRDADVLRAWRYMRHALSGSALRVLALTLELEVLTQELDQRMVEALAPGTFTGTTYAAAYRAVGDEPARRRQLELALAAGTKLDEVVRHPWAGRALRLMHFPAHAAGFGALQDFLERGFAAFERMGGAERFLQAVRDRELALMQALLAGDEPFEQLDGGGTQ
jgi:hypothetical protein